MEVHAQKVKSNYLFFILLFSILAVGAPAQEGVTLSVSPLYSMPLGTSTEVYQYGFGGNFEVKTPFVLQSLEGFGNIQYENIFLQAGAGNLNLLLLGGGVRYVPFRSGIFSGAVLAGTGAYMGFYKDNNPLLNPYVTTGVSLDFALSDSFHLSAQPVYKNLIARRDGSVVSFYSSLDFTIQVSLHPSTMGGGTRRPKIKIGPPEFYQIFPVIYKYYDNHSIGSVTVKNGENSKIKNILVSFYVPQYMDSPRVIAEIDGMKPGEERTLPITALFRNEILNITEKDSVQSLISVDYYAGSAPLSAKRTESLKIYDRNSINWDDTRKAAAFVTAKDPTILKFSRNVTSEVARKGNRVINQNLSDAIAVIEALRLYGITYKIDPDSSYAELSKNETATDYLQFPVQTLDYQTGDCDDMSILYSSMLEAVSVETAFITTPGHIYVAFSLGLTKAQAQKIFSNTENLIFLKEKVWMPVEVTALGDGFMKAWNLGAREWREAAANDAAELFPLRKAWAEYEPTWFGTGENSSVATRFPKPGEIVSAYTASMKQFTRMQVTPLVASLESRIKKRPSPRLINRLGTVYANYGMYTEAKKQFSKAARTNYVPALVNLGNISYLHSNYKEALTLYNRAYKQNHDSTAVLLAVARAQFELEKYSEARKYYKQAQHLDPKAASRFAYIGGGSDSTGRAADAGERKTVLWADE